MYAYALKRVGSYHAFTHAKAHLGPRRGAVLGSKCGELAGVAVSVEPRRGTGARVGGGKKVEQSNGGRRGWGRGRGVDGEVGDEGGGEGGGCGGKKVKQSTVGRPGWGRVRCVDGNVCEQCVE